MITCDHWDREIKTGEEFYNEGVGHLSHCSVWTPYKSDDQALFLSALW